MSESKATEGGNVTLCDLAEEQPVQEFDDIEQARAVRRERNESFQGRPWYMQEGIGRFFTLEGTAPHFRAGFDVNPRLSESEQAVARAWIAERQKGLAS